MDRRTFLRGATVLAAAAGSAGVLETLAPAAGAATAPLPIGGRDNRLFAPHALDYRSGFQSFAWAPKAKAFLYAQPSPRAGHSGITEAKHYGDLLVSTITTSGRTSSSHMQLNGFGHGGTMGVETSTGGYSYVWLDTSAAVSGNPDTSADPRAICCFRYTGKGTYTPHDLSDPKRMPHAQRYVLKPGSSHNAVTYDPTTRRIALRYVLNGKSRYSIYDVATLRSKGAGAALRYDAVPAGTVEAGAKGSFQSFALWGEWLYALRGSKSEKNDATLHAYHLPTRRASHAALNAAAGTRGREPEGLCVYYGSTTARLAFGIKNDPSSGRVQTSSVYYKS